VDYCQYWYIKKNTPEKEYSSAIDLIKKFIIHHKDVFKQGRDENDAQISFKDSICITAKEGEFVGDLYLPLSIEQYKTEIVTKANESFYFYFVRTDMMPHDTYIVAILTILKVKLRNYIFIRSDGQLKTLSKGIVMGLNFLNFNNVNFDFHVNDERPRMETIYECIFQSGNI